MASSTKKAAPTAPVEAPDSVASPSSETQTMEMQRPLGSYDAPDAVLLRLAPKTYAALAALGLDGDEYEMPGDVYQASMDFDQLVTWLLKTYPVLNDEIEMLADKLKGFDDYYELRDKLKSKKKQVQMLLDMLVRSENADELRIKEIINRVVEFGIRSGIGRLPQEIAAFVELLPGILEEVEQLIERATTKQPQPALDAAQDSDEPQGEAVAAPTKDEPAGEPETQPAGEPAANDTPPAAEPAGEPETEPAANDTPVAETTPPAAPEPAETAAASPAPAVVATQPLPALRAVAARKHAAWMDYQHKEGNLMVRSTQGENLMVPFDELSEKSQANIEREVQQVYDAVLELWQAQAVADVPAEEAGSVADAQDAGGEVATTSSEE